MKEEIKKEIIKYFIPKEKTFEEKNITRDDLLIIIGWNMYREEILKGFNKL